MKGKLNLRNRSILTVGARALCKHAPRSSDGFWTRNDMIGPPKNASSIASVTVPLTGSEAEKNRKAFEKLQEILDHCVWINLHSMLNAGSVRESICILEVRVATGHGARWSWINPTNIACDPFSSDVAIYDHSPQIQFRGFVEPMSSEGHEMKWMH